jgi:hypothetical protein
MITLRKNFYAHNASVAFILFFKLQLKLFDKDTRTIQLALQSCINMLIPVHIVVVAVINLDFLREFGKSDLKDMTIKELH